MNGTPPIEIGKLQRLLSGLPPALQVLIILLFLRMDSPPSRDLTDSVSEIVLQTQRPVAERDQDKIDAATKKLLNIGGGAPWNSSVLYLLLAAFLASLTPKAVKAVSAFKQGTQVTQVAGGAGGGLSGTEYILVSAAVTKILERAVEGNAEDLRSIAEAHNKSTDDVKKALRKMLVVVVLSRHA